MAIERNKQQAGQKIKSQYQKTSSQSLPPRRLYYSFADALKIIRSKVENCTADYLLYCGLMGNLKFFIHVPYGYCVYTVCELGAKWNDLMDPPRLLILDRLDCGAIEWNKKTIQSSFSCGYWFDGAYFREIYPKPDQSWPAQEIKWCVFENVTYDPLRRSQSDFVSESKPQSEKRHKAIIDPNSRNRNVVLTHISNASDQSLASDPNNFQTTQFVKDIGLAISEKTLFVMHDELTKLIQHEVTSLELATEIASKDLHEESLYQKTLKAGLAFHLPFKIRERANNYLSPAIYYTLKEAVDVVKQRLPECTASKLLEFGLANKLTFMTPVPVGVDLTVDSYTFGPPDCLYIKPCLVPPLLIVESAECETILRKGELRLGRFKRGHDYLSAPINNFPVVRRDGSPSSFYLWATEYQGKFHEIKVTPDRLFVLQSELANLVLTEPGPWKTDRNGLPGVHDSLFEQPTDNTRLIEEQSPSSLEVAIADSPEQRPSTLSEREVCKRLGRSRTTINAYQNEKDEKNYDPSFPKKRKVTGSTRSIEYLESEVTRWGNDHPRPK